MKSIIIRASLAALICLGTQGIFAQNNLSITADVTDLSCNSFNGPNDGSIDIQVEGGTPPYNYTWTGQGVNTTAQDQNSLSNGTYSVVVRDANGFTEEANFTLEMPEQLFISATLLSPECNFLNGDSNGSIDITASGGTAPYSHLWSGPDICPTCEDQTGLGTGTFCITLIDANNCEVTSCFELTEPDALQIAEILTHPSCNGANGPLDGSIDIVVTGGAAPYTYTWTGSGIDQTTQDQSGLSSGTYCVTVTDANGCETSKCYDLTEPKVISILADVTQPSCASNGDININVTGGTPPFTYIWSNGFTGSSNTNLNPGTYNLSVTDSNGCSWETFYDLILESFVVEHTQINLDCENQFVDYEIIVTGDNGPYFLSYTTSTGGTIGNLDNNLGQTGGTALATNIEIGHRYTIAITDNEGCSRDITIDAITGLETNLESPRLCLVTTTTTGNIQVLWEDIASTDSSTEYNIYRESTTSGNFEKIATIENDLDNSYIDLEAEHTTRSYQYYVTASDDCGNESNPSAIHKTIHLQIGQGVGGTINLQWDEYKGIDYNNVIILRGNTPTDLVEYASLPANIFTFTDDNPPSGDVFYQVATGVSVDCTINKSLFQLRSNLAALIETNTEEIEWSENIYPNPVYETLNIDLEQPARLTIINTRGQEIRQFYLQKGNNQLSTSELNSGLYFIHLLQGTDVFVTRLIKE